MDRSESVKERNDRIFSFYKMFPDSTLKEIGKKFGIGEPAVSRIISSFFKEPKGKQG